MPAQRSPRQSLTFDYRLAQEAINLRLQANGMPAGVRRAELLRKARQIDVAGELNKWLTSPGPRLQSQLARMQEHVRQAETPIRVALASDNATDVQIYRIGKLGLFEHRDLDLMPGRYTVVGTRQGYRDVRKELNVLPGAPPPELVVRCEEPI